MSDTRREAETLEEMTTQYRNLVNNFLDFSAKLNNYFLLTAQQLEERRNGELQQQGTNPPPPTTSPLLKTSDASSSPDSECCGDNDDQSSNDCNEPICPNRPLPSASIIAHTGYIQLPFTEESRVALINFIPPQSPRASSQGAETADGCLTISCPNCSSKLEIKIEVKRI